MRLPCTIRSRKGRGINSSSYPPYSCTPKPFPFSFHHIGGGNRGFAALTQILANSGAYGKLKMGVHVRTYCSIKGELSRRNGPKVTMQPKGVEKVSNRRNATLDGGWGEAEKRKKKDPMR